MEVLIISTESIKPSSPTPCHLKTHNLSLRDQASLDIYYPIVLFYSNAPKNTTKISDHLKKSLSETLTHYYPFAGRVKDDYSIDCDDYGITFIEARVAMKMCEVLKRPEIAMLEQLMPFNPHEEVSNQVNLAVRLNYFDCGGVAICLCFGHGVADGAAAAYFIQNWASVARGSHDIKDVIFDCTSIFPPHDMMRSLFRRLVKKQRPKDCITKRFLFDGAKVAALMEKMNNGSCLDRPITRFEAVSAVIWGALIDMARKSDEATPLAQIIVNVRRKTNPPLPPQCIGNVIHPAIANWLTDKAIDYSGLARTIREAVKTVNDDNVRKAYEGNALVNQLRKALEESVNSSDEVIKAFGFSGLSGFSLYVNDFGWGKPTWASAPMRLYNAAFLLDTYDGKGIETWVGMTKKDMANFEQDPAILAFASFDPIIVSSSKL